MLQCLVSPYPGALGSSFPKSGNTFGSKAQGKSTPLAQGEAISAMTVGEIQGQANKEGSLKLSRIISRQIKGISTS